MTNTTRAEELALLAGFDLCDPTIKGKAQQLVELCAHDAVECVRCVLRDSESTLNYDDAGRVQDAIYANFTINKGTTQ